MKQPFSMLHFVLQLVCCSTRCGYLALSAIFYALEKYTKHFRCPVQVVSTDSFFWLLFRAFLLSDYNIFHVFLQIVFFGFFMCATYAKPTCN